MLEEEVWKPIPGFKGYEVSNKGRIKSFKHYLRLKRAPKGKNLEDLSAGRILKQRIILDKGKYPRCYIVLTNNKKYYNFTIHRLVLLAFVGQNPSGFVCCHNDGNPLNNDLINLRWDTPKNNTLDSKKHGTWSKPPICKEKGIERYNAKFTEKDIIDMRKIPKYRGLIRDLSKQYNCSNSVISNILKRTAWKHL